MGWLTVYVESEKSKFRFIYIFRQRNRTESVLQRATQLVTRLHNFELQVEKFQKKSKSINENIIEDQEKLAVLKKGIDLMKQEAGAQESHHKQQEEIIHTLQASLEDVLRCLDNLEKEPDNPCERDQKRSKRGKFENNKRE